MNDHQPHNLGCLHACAVDLDTSRKENATLRARVKVLEKALRLNVMRKRSSFDKLPCWCAEDPGQYISPDEDLDDPELEHSAACQAARAALATKPGET